MRNLLERDFIFAKNLVYKITLLKIFKNLLELLFFIQIFIIHILSLLFQNYSSQ